MSISKKEVEHVANLARLELSEAEANTYTEQLSAILNFSQKLNELDTDNVEPTSQVLDMANVLRKDEGRPSISREKALKNAPEEEDGQFSVPPIL